MMSRQHRPLTDQDREKARERIARADAKIKADLEKIRPGKVDGDEGVEDEYSWGTIWTKTPPVSRWRERHELGGVL